MPNRKSMQRLTLLVPMLLGVTACVGSPAIFAASSACSTLLPDAWDEGVGHAPPPVQSADPLVQLKEWIKFATAEAAQVEKADGRYRDGKQIVSRCEERDAKAVKASRSKFLGLF